MALLPQDTWETPRLVARPAVAEHAQMVFDAYARDPEVAKYMTWMPHRQVGDTTQFLHRCESVWKEGSAYPWTIWRKEDGTLVGLIEIRVAATAVDLGYALGRRWWRQGLMTEALTPLVHWALAQPAIHRVWATCDIDNVASARVLERVGMEREGILRRWQVHPNVSETPRDCFCYATVR